VEGFSDITLVLCVGRLIGCWIWHSFKHMPDRYSCGWYTCQLLLPCVGDTINAVQPFGAAACAYFEVRLLRYKLLGNRIGDEEGIAKDDGNYCMLG
jgi:hypothetical protein